MSTNLLPFHVTTFPTSTSVNRLRRISTSASNGGGANWWSPLFGWSSDADYIDSSSDHNKKEDPNSDSDPKEAAPRSKFTPGRFTEEKAKQLRMMTMDTASFHDVMYHSAIASRLASDFSQRSDP